MTSWRHTVSVLAGAALVAGALATGIAPGRVRAEGPKRGGTIVYALPPGTNITWYFPLANSTNDSLYNFQLIDQLYKPLIYIGNNYLPNWHSSIARRVGWNAAGTVYHVFLNPKWHWSDGTPVTSSDVLFTWHVLVAASTKNAPAPWPYVGAGSGDIPGGVESVTAQGPYEVTVVLKHPANQEWFEYNGLNQLVPLPAQAWDRYGNRWTQEVNYLGRQATNPGFDKPVDGPYRLQSATSNQTWVLVPNRRYDGQRSLVSRFIFQYEGSDAVELAGLKTGAIQVGYLPIGLYPARAQLARLDSIRPVYSLAFNQVLVNMTPEAMGGVNQIFDHLYVRQALQMGVDQAGILQHFYYGQGVAGTGPIPVKPATPFLDPRLKRPLYPFNLRRARALLTRHGWHEVHGVMTKGHEQMQFQLVYSSGDTATAHTMELIQHDWGLLGVRVRLRPMPFATMISLANNKWQIMGGVGWMYGGSYPSGYALYDSRGGVNHTVGYVNGEADHLISLTHKPWPTERANLHHFYQYEYFIAQQVPNLWVPNSPSLQVHEKTVHNSYRYTEGVTGAFQPNYWWISH